MGGCCPASWTRWRRPASPRSSSRSTPPTPRCTRRTAACRGVCERIRGANARAAERGIMPIASVAMSRLVTDYTGAGRFLRELGFAAVTFSYPRKAPLGSSSLVWSEDSDLVDLSPGRAAGRLRRGGRGAATSSRSTTRAPRSPTCAAGCAARRSGSTASPATSTSTSTGTTTSGAARTGSEPLCPVWEFEPGKTVRDGCQACTTDCYRDASVMLHFAVALGDAFARLSEGRPVAAASALADRRNAASLGAVIAHGSRLGRLAGVG